MNGVYEKDPTNKNAKKIQKIELRKLRNMLAHEDTIAGGYDLMDFCSPQSNRAFAHKDSHTKGRYGHFGARNQGRLRWN